jgi:hypothetical protein
MNTRLALWVLSIVLVACAQEQGVTDPTSATGPLARLVGKATSCPSGGTPGPGDVVAGGIEVDGECLLDRLTVTGGIVVDPGADLEIEGSAISGGIEVSACGELDVDLADHTAPSGATSTISGDVHVTASTDCPSGGFSDIDIWTARINGKLVISGSYLGGPTICDNQISDDVVLDHLTSVHPFWLGDPDIACPGNRIGGTLSVSNSLAVGAGRTLEVEANSVAGSVLLRASTLEFNENTIGGSLLCSNGTLILTAEPDDDPVSNTVRGKNTCG